MRSSACSSCGGSGPSCSRADRSPARGSSPTGSCSPPAYQLSIAGLLLGTVAATGHTLSPLAVLGAFGASQLAGAVPGPNGASPRDGALVVALAALGVPWEAAAAAVALKAALAWLPALPWAASAFFSSPTLALRPGAPYPRLIALP